MIVGERLGPLADAATEVGAGLVESDAVARMWAGDASLWPAPGAAEWLGWLSAPDATAERVDELVSFAAAAADDGLRHAVVLGMGGSSLFPEVLASAFPTGPGGLELSILDTTSPAAIARVEAELDINACLFVVASKSGTTIETRSHLAYFWDRTDRRGDQFVAITDPGSELAGLARRDGFRAVFENDPEVGGRYSALSLFGAVPAALLGADLKGLVASAQVVAAALGRSVDAADNPALKLAGVLGAGPSTGRDKLTLVMPDAIAGLGDWIEQLLAESTGKDGTGLVPVVGEPLGTPDVYGDDRIFVAIGSAATDPRLDALADAGHPVINVAYGQATDLAGLVFLFEVAVALTGAVLGINPFDQPDVAAAKEATAKVLGGGGADIEAVALDSLLDQVGPGDYIAIQAFVDPGDPGLRSELETARAVLRDRYQVATTLGIGPRFLHSTGQLHKGGPPTGVFIQVVADEGPDLAIPGRDFGFSALLRAQADGDLGALRQRGSRAGRVSIDELVKVGL